MWTPPQVIIMHTNYVWTAYMLLPVSNLQLQMYAELSNKHQG